MTVRITTQSIDSAAEAGELARLQNAGALVTFSGICRGEEDGAPISALFLEHYPGMAEAEIERHIAEAKSRWPILGARIVHRTGRIEARLNASGAMHDSRAQDRPARFRFRDVAPAFGFGHAGIVLEKQRRNRRTVLLAAADAGKGHQRSGVLQAREFARFGGGIDALRGDADGHGGIIAAGLVISEGRAISPSWPGLSRPSTPCWPRSR